MSTAGRYGGTWGCKELVYAYAMWISAAFHLKVIRAYDAMVTTPATSSAFVIPQTFAEALRIAADLAEQKEAKAKRLAIAAPLARVQGSRDCAIFTIRRFLVGEY